MRWIESLNASAVTAALVIAFSTPVRALPPIAPVERICPAPSSPIEKVVRKGVPEAQVRVPDYAGITPRPIPDALRGSIRRVDLPPGVKLVALTFDLCETPNEVAGYDGEIFDTLRTAHIPATFFSGGHWAETHVNRFGEIANTPQFEIGNHTWTHANLRVVDADKLKREIYAPIAAFAEVAGQSQCARPDASHENLPRFTLDGARPTLFRFPFGACNPASMAAVNDAGMLAIQWDVSADDASPFRTADMIVKDALPAIKPGSIILAHANGRGYHTGAALPRIIADLKARGFQFVTVSELLAAGKPVISSTCYDYKPGDTDKYDSWGRKKVAPLPAPQPASTGLRPSAAPAAKTN